MNALMKYLLKVLPLCAVLLVLFSASPAYASFWDTLVDAAKEAAGKAAAAVLGIDLTDNCPLPTTDDNECLFCPLFRLLFNAGSDIAKKSYEAFSSDLGTLVATFLAVSLALIVLRNIATMGAKDPGALLNDLLKKAFLGAIIYIIITKDYYNVINLTLTPVFKSGMGLVLSGNTSCANAASLHGFTSTAGSGTGGLPMEMGASIVCAVEDIEKKIGLLFEFGEWAFCLGTGPERWFLLIPNLIFLIDGLILYVAGILFMVAYPWIMGDAVLQLGIAMAIAPFAICGYAFAGTKSYLGTVWKWILNSLFTFMFMAILLMCVLGYIENILLAALDKCDGNPKKMFLYPNDGIAFYGPNMVKIIFILFIGWAYMPTVSNLSKTFSGGSGLSAVGAVGNKITDTINSKARKAADWTAGAVGNATVAAANTTGRRARAVTRGAVMYGVNRFGSSTASGGKQISFGRIKFQTEKNADGSQVLRREVKSITGRKHVMVSDKYSTIRQRFDRNGNEIRCDVEFKHNFVKKHLLNKDGTMNMGAVQKLLDSPAAQNPDYKKAIMTQLAIEVAKAKGKDVGKYYRSRNVLFDPNNPFSIKLEQVDQTGKTTTLEMDLNSATGQVAIKFLKQRDRNRYENFGHKVNMGRKKLGRMANINFVAMNIEDFGHSNADGSKSWNSVGGLVKYTLRKDASGKEYYEREARKYVFFGKKIKKTYSRDGVELEIKSNAGVKAQNKQNDKLSKLNERIMNNSHYRNASGGYVHKGFRNITESHVDPATGDTYYTVTENKGFFRKAWNPTVKTTTYYKDKTVTEIKDKNGNVIYKHTDHVRKFGDESQTIRKGIDGTRTYKDDITGDVKDKTLYSGEYEMFFDNAMVQIRTTGYKSGGSILDGTAQTAGEKTTFKFSEKAQAGHDSILNALDGNQVVEKNGKIADNLDPAKAGEPGYRGDLTYGMDEVFGLKQINGTPMKDFVVKNIFAEGRGRRTNKLRTNLDLTRDFYYVADESGHIIGKADKSSGHVVGNSGSGMGVIAGDGNLYDSTGRVIGHII